MAETLRSIVHPWECDAVEHFTTAYYFRAYGAAEWHLMQRLGYPDDALKGIRPISCRAGFSRELRAGDAYHIESGVIEEGDDRLTIGHRLYNSETRELSASHVTTLVGPPMSPREDLHIAWEDDERGADVDFKALGRWSTTSQSVVGRGDFDYAGRLGLDALIHHTSDANVQFQNLVGMTSSYMLERKIGFATFAYQIRIHDLPRRPGTIMKTESALAHLGNSSLWYAHRVVDALTGAAIADVAQLGVHFDRDARRPAAIPDHIRRRATTFLGQSAPQPQAGT